MALTTEQLALAVRAGDSPQETQLLERLQNYAVEAVQKHLNGGTASDAIRDEAVIRIVAFLFDQPNVSRGQTYSRALRNSGALDMLSPYRLHRAGRISNG